MEEEFECPNCRIIECFYKKLKLTEEEIKKLKELESNPEAAIKFLQSIRSEEELKQAWKSCSI